MRNSWYKHAVRLILYKSIFLNLLQNFIRPFFKFNIIILGYYSIISRYFVITKLRIMRCRKCDMDGVFLCVFWQFSLYCRHSFTSMLKYTVDRINYYKMLSHYLISQFRITLIINVYLFLTFLTLYFKTFSRCLNWYYAL